MQSLPDFNPRSREGSDYIKGGTISGQTIISILAPARGATQRTFLTLGDSSLFQSSLPRGERRTQNLEEALI